MACFRVETLSFSYPGADNEALSALSFSIAPGEFVTLIGESGCGKTTLLRLLKPCLSPEGTQKGSILFYGQPLSSLSPRAAAAEIGFVAQDPASQLVTDTVWHELAFGLESLGCDTMEIRTRVAEMASFFGIQNWFHKKVDTLSGGQKQILNLASVLVMQPRVLLLDEPTSQLDPIAAREFLVLLHRISRELGTAVLLSEHRLSEALPLSDRVLVLENGHLLAYDTPRRIGTALRGHAIESALPAAMQLAAVLSPAKSCPVSILEGKQFLETLPVSPDASRIPVSAPPLQSAPIVRMERVWFRYEKAGADILQNASLSVSKGECFAILGGNGTGKTTLLSLLGGALTPLRGTVWRGGRCAMLPQNPACLFSKSTVRETLCDSADASRGLEMAQLCRLTHLLHRHPFDLSGGEQMRLAIAVLLLSSPEILLLDEPTRGMDAGFKSVFADILRTLSEKGTAIILVSHDIEFCAKYAHRCALFFDGSLVSEGAPRTFFADKAFYTTAANRIARTILPTAILPEDILAAYGAAPALSPVPPSPIPTEEISIPAQAPKKKLHPRFFLGTLLLFLCLAASICRKELLSGFTAKAYLFQGFSILAFAFSLFLLLPHRAVSLPEKPRRRKTRPRRFAVLFPLLSIPLTLVWGLHALSERKYYFICLLVILEILVPFLLSFEKRKPSAKEIVCISVLCALTAASRAAFSFLPQFKPVLALVLLSGVALGGETGFLVGALSALLSNFLFGQGPWTPWQMFATGLVGFLGGLLFHRNILRPSRLSLSLFGAILTFFLYGTILNLSSLLLWYPEPTWALLLSTLAMGIVPDAIHALSTAFFLWFLSVPLLKTLERFRKRHSVFPEE